MGVGVATGVAVGTGVTVGVGTGVGDGVGVGVGVMIGVGPGLGKSVLPYSSRGTAASKYCRLRTPACIVLSTRRLLPS